jgi:DNA invertase Pin-like site-specific DNA recombinase
MAIVPHSTRYDAERAVIAEFMTRAWGGSLGREIRRSMRLRNTSTRSGRAMFQMMGVFAEFERAMIRERVLAGLARAKQDGIHLGRKFTEDTKDGNRKIKAALAMRAKGVGIRKIAREVGLGVGTVLRLTATS